MAKTNPKIGNSVGVQLQPEARLIDNPAQKTVAAVLASGKRQVNATAK
jgi:hypothetical protein